MNTFSRAIAPWTSRGLSLLVLASSTVLAQTADPDRTADPNRSDHLVFLGDFASRFNREVWWMSIWAIILSILIFIAVSWALFYSVAKFRERKGDTREPAQFHGNNTLEIVLIVVPFIIVTVLSVLTVRTMARLNTDAYVKDMGQAATKVEVLGAQFWWNFTYPDLGGFRNGNEMVMPTGKPVEIAVTARDVIHGFWAPNIGGQRHLLPGVTNNYFVDIDRPGMYQGNCTQLCGASHANMRFKVIVLPQDRYNTFIRAAQAYRAPTPAAGSAEARGAALFLNGKNGQGSCAACHREQGTAAAGINGPDLSFFGTRRTLGAGMWEGEDVNKMLPQWIKHSKVVKPGSLMPSYDGTQEGYPELTDAELADLSAYMRSLKLPEEADYWQGVDNNSAFWGEKK